MSDEHEHFSWLHLPWRPILIVPAVAAGIFLLVGVALFMSRSEGEAPAIVTTGLNQTSAVNPFLRCGDCHDDLDASLKADPNPLLRFRHGAHFRTGISDCAQCHVANTHTPDKTRLPEMVTCAKCHEKDGGKAARAPGTCTTCHPPSVDEAPPSHTLEAWAPAAHAERARISGAFDCAQCHSETTCQSCHGLQMPHPQAYGRQPHVQQYFDDPQLCARCHEPTTATQQGRDSCDTCHHPQGPQNQSWVQAHPDVITARGAASCFQCHAQETCASCHDTGTFDLWADRPLAIEGSSTTGSNDSG